MKKKINKLPRKIRRKYHMTKNNDKGQVYFYQKTPGQSPEDIIKDLQDQGIIPEGIDSVYFPSSNSFNDIMQESFSDFTPPPKQNDKATPLTEFVDTRVSKLKSEDPQKATIYSVAASYVFEFRDICSAIKTVFDKYPVGVTLNEYLNTMTYYVKEYNMCLTDIKSLMLFIHMALNPTTGGRRLVYNTDYRLVYDSINTLLRLVLFTKTNTPTVISPIGHSTLIPDDVYHINWDTVTQYYQDDPELIILAQFFDEILQYTIDNNLLV